MFYEDFFSSDFCFLTRRVFLIFCSVTLTLLISLYLFLSIETLRQFSLPLHVFEMISPSHYLSLAFSTSHFPSMSYYLFFCLFHMKSVNSRAQRQMSKRRMAKKQPMNEGRRTKRCVHMIDTQLTEQQKVLDVGQSSFYSLLQRSCS